MISDWQLYKQNMWNIVDCIRAVLGILVIVMRYMLAFGSLDGDGARDAVEWWSHETGGWAHQGSWMVFDDSRVSTLDTEHMCKWSWKLEAVRTFAASLMLISTFRMMEVLTFHRDVGVLLVCVWEMIADLYNWAKPAMIITTGFGLVMHMLAPEYRLDGSPGAWRPFRIGWLNLDLDISSAGPFWMTAWGLLGFFEPGELSAAPGSAFLAPVFLWFYLLIQLVLFVNLLIAMFSRSYAKIMAQADENWKMKRVVQVKSYITAHCCPPPFNIVTLPPTLLYHSLCSARKMAGAKKAKAPAAASSGICARINCWRGRRVAPEEGGTPSLPRGGGPGGDKSTFRKSATSFAAEMEDGAKDIFAAWTFTAAKAQAVEERARRAFLDREEKQEEKQEEVPRKLDQLEKLILEATEATKKLEQKQERQGRRGLAVARWQNKSSPPRRSSSQPSGGGSEEMSAFHLKLDKLSQLVAGLAAGSLRVALGAPVTEMEAPRLPPPLPRQAPKEGQQNSSGPGETEGMALFHTKLDRISQQVHQVAENQQVLSQHAQQQGQQMQQQGQQVHALMNQRHTAGPGEFLALPNPQHGRAWTPQQSQASYLQKAGIKHAAAQPFPPLTAEASEIAAPLPYRPPPAPLFPGLPLPPDSSTSVPSAAAAPEVKRRVSFGDVSSS